MFLKLDTNHTSFLRMDETLYMDDGTFERNILIVGRTECDKTFFQNLAKNRLFGDIKEVFWISKIEVSRDREENI